MISAFKEKSFRGGTPKYFSPEVYEKAGYSGKEDMYSFGIKLYYILSGGKYLYDFKNTMTRAVDSEYIVSESIPDKLQCMIKKATAYNPDDRYASMSELCDELRVVCQTAESYEPIPISDYYEAEIAYTCTMFGEPETDRSIMEDDILDTVISE